MTVLSIFLIAIAFIALAVLLTSLMANGLIDGESPSKKRDNSSSCEYDESDQSPSMFEGWFNGDLDKDMYGNPIHPERYRRAKRREAKFFGETYIDD